MNMQGLEASPKASRLHIGLFGRRNAGKSSLLNALAGQPAAIVSPVPGSTTDPVEKTMEMAPLGPVVLIDTAGVDDEGQLGRQRAERSLRALRDVDVALLITEGNSWSDFERRLLRLLADEGIPFAVVRTKCDLHDAASLAERPGDLPGNIPVADVSTVTGEGLAALRELLVRLAPGAQDTPPPLLHDLLPENGLVLFIVPVDSGAPKGRLILPQAQCLRDCLDGRKLALTATEKEIAPALAALSRRPDLAVCDSQVVHVAARELPPSQPLTTFSLLMARARGNLTQLAQGAAALSHLRPGDVVELREACSHHPQKDDIGRVKLPRLLAKIAGGPVTTRMLAGKNAESDDAPRPKLVIHCGACTLTRRQMLRRQHDARARGIPMTNYGMAISYAQGVLERVLSPFPDALQAFGEALKKERKSVSL